MKNLPRPIHRALHILLLADAAILLGLHSTHLTADFPNYSAWMDWSNYTAEGWYGEAAILFSGLDTQCIGPCVLMTIKRYQPPPPDFAPRAQTSARGPSL